MKKIFSLFMAIAFVAPIIAGAVTWKLDSSPFKFPGVGVKNPVLSNTIQSVRLCRPMVSNGIVTIQYSLPQNTRGATLSIYNLYGVRVQSFNLAPGANAIRWGVSSQRAAAGVYLATMRYGTNEEKIKISIVK
jgi:hypothetical protein